MNNHASGECQSNTIETPIFLPRFTCLPARYVPVVSTNTWWFDGLRGIARTSSYLGHRKNMWSPDAQQVTTGRSTPMSGTPDPATCQLIEPRVLISNGNIWTTGRGKVDTRRVRCTPVMYAERLSKAWDHRTQPPDSLLSVRCLQSETLAISQLKSSHTGCTNKV